ncbi:MAG: hypothetical protein RL000_1248 [Bacteroidota bacterium]|jgi:uncharacterized protein YjbI with pentapeptide repeats
MNFIESKTFENIDFQKEKFVNGEYEGCIFNSCNLSNTDLSKSVFIDCVFNNCNLSNAKINNVVFREVKFNGCKLMGLFFDTANENGLAFSFEHSILDNSSFVKTKIKHTKFIHCSIKDVDFSIADLSECIFHQCDLLNAHFEMCNLEKADFLTAFNYRFDLDQNKVKGSKHSIHQIKDLLDKYKLIIE